MPSPKTAQKTPKKPLSKEVPKRAWQRMLSGRRLDLLNPSPMDIEIEDIAHGLSRVARWNGQTTGEYPFTVLQHSLVVDDILPMLDVRLENKWRLACLLHDAAEYVVGDMISPFKNALGVNYREFEDKLQRAIHLRFGLPAETPDEIKKIIKQADIICAYFEATQLAGFSEEEGEKFFCKKPKKIIQLVPEKPDIVKGRYLERFRILSA
jgi:5'-deoxynucleotidase YfbR-like HD superfamily hydrolase